jgi:hypothetical protein
MEYGVGTRVRSNCTVDAFISSSSVVVVVVVVVVDRAAQREKRAREKEREKRRERERDVLLFLEQNYFFEFFKVFFSISFFRKNSLYHFLSLFEHRRAKRKEKRKKATKTTGLVYYF